jgi:hypothetical protein
VPIVIVKLPQNDIFFGKITILQQRVHVLCSLEQHQRGVAPNDFDWFWLSNFCKDKATIAKQVAAQSLI